MKQLALLLGCLLSASAWGQGSLGMTISRYYNWGQESTWNHVAKQHPTDMSYDSASRAPAQLNSPLMKSVFWVGGQYRFLPKDSTVFMHKWSRNFWLQGGEITTDLMLARDTFTDNSNIPYTVIYQGDTTTYNLDTVRVVQHQLYGKGGFAQLSFGMLRTIRTETRVIGEFGFRLNAGFGSLNSHHEGVYVTYVADSASESPVPWSYSGTIVQTRERNTLFMGGAELSGGILIPLEKEDDTWWLGIHGSLGVTAMNYMGVTLMRTSFVPVLSINYRFLPEGERLKRAERIKQSEGE